jgi:AcrR family transcriptional regulator
MNTPLLPETSNTLSVDGRTARRDRGRTAVLEAALDLFEEENLEPTPEQIALRAGVSTRSVYRYFQDRDELVRAIIAHKQLKILPLFHIENIGKGDLDTRLSRLVDSRLRVYDATGATARAMAIKASSDPVIHEQIQFRKSVFREQVENNFRQEFDRMTTSQRSTSLNAIDALTQLDVLDRFHVDLQLSLDETRDVLIASIQALLTIASHPAS